MQLKRTPIITAFCLLGLVATPAFAADTADSSKEQQLIEKLSQQTAALQKEVTSLQSQVKALKSQKVNERRAIKGQKVTGTTIVTGDHVTVANSNVQSANKPMVLQAIGKDPVYVGGTPIVTSPFLGEHAAYDASDLIVYMSSVGMDLRLLQQRDKIYGIYKQYGLPVPATPLLDVSGGLEAQYTNQRPYTGNRTSNIDLTRGELDIAANINVWTTGFMALTYDNAPPSVGQRVSNSRIFLDKGFITIGNLVETPFYGTVGQFYVPFGRYSTYMISDTLPKMLARVKARAALLGFDRT